MSSPLITIKSNHLIKSSMSSPKKSRTKREQYKKKGKAKNFFDQHDIGDIQISVGGNGENIGASNFDNQDNKSDTSRKRINDGEKECLTVEKAGDDIEQGPLSCTSPRSSRSFNYGFSTTISTRLNENSEMRSSMVLALDSSRTEAVDDNGQVVIVAKKKGRKS